VYRVLGPGPARVQCSGPGSGPVPGSEVCDLCGPALELGRYPCVTAAVVHVRAVDGVPAMGFLRWGSCDGPPLLCVGRGFSLFGGTGI
jgi:hypothetical protein